MLLGRQRGLKLICRAGVFWFLLRQSYLLMYVSLRSTRQLIIGHGKISSVVQVTLNDFLFALCPLIQVLILFRPRRGRIVLPSHSLRESLLTSELWCSLL